MSVTSRILLAVLPLVITAAASGLDENSVLCLCADDARNHGDYVSCVSHLSRRLVATDVLDEAGRSEFIRNAAHSQVPEEPLHTACGSEAGYGTGVQTDRHSYFPGERARIEGLYWNLSGQDAFGQASSGDGGGPGGGGPDRDLLPLWLSDAEGRTVHFDLLPPLPAVTPYRLESGRVRRFAIEIELVHRNSALGLPDGTPLEPGTYFAELGAGARFPFPEPPASFTSDGIGTRARIPIILEVGP